MSDWIEYDDNHGDHLYKLSYGFGDLMVVKERYHQKYIGRWTVYDNNGIVETTHLTENTTANHAKLDAVALLRMALSSTVAELERFAEV